MASTEEQPVAPSAAAEDAAEQGESTRVNRSSRRSRRSLLFRRSSLNPFRRSSVNPQVTKYQDHFSLQSPTTVVRFHDKKSAARVIYNQSSQLVIEEKYDAETKKRNIIIKQIAEESAGSLQFLRLTYTLVAAFFLGFLFVFTFQVMLLVGLDLAIHLGITDMQTDLEIGSAIGVLLSFPVWIHGFALIMMLGGVYVKDLWRGHPLFLKFVCPNGNEELIEWLFVLSLLIMPLIVMGACLCAGTEDWWRITALYWFFSVFASYITFVISVLLFEARVFVQATVGIGWIQGFSSFCSKLKAFVVMRECHTLSGYKYTEYLSFGTPDSICQESRKFIIEGTLSENKRGLYARFTQLSCLQGCLYTTLDTPQRLYSVDDIADRRPYVTSYSWGLEKYFCRPRKSRYIGIVKGPGAMTRRQVKSTIVCSAIGVVVVYFILVAVLVYYDFGGGLIFVVVVIFALLSSPFIMGPFRRYRELARLKLLKEDHMERANTDNQNTTPETTPNGGGENTLSTVAEEVDPNRNEEEAHEVSLKGSTVRVSSLAYGGSKDQVEPELTVTEKDDDDAAGKPSVRFASGTNLPADNNSSNVPRDSEGSESMEWKGFQANKEHGSMGVYAVNERYRITEPSEAYCFSLAFINVLLFGFWPTFSLYWIESWQLATVYLVLAAVVFLRHHTNTEILVQEKGHIMIEDDVGVDQTTKWKNQSRLSQATVSRGKSYYAWRVLYILFTVVLIVFCVQAVNTETESTTYGNFHMVDNYSYETQDSLHYTSCELNRNLNGNLASSLADYMFLSALVYRKPELSTPFLTQWYGEEGSVVDRSDIVEGFRSAYGDEDIPVYYRLYTAEFEGKTYAAVAIRGTQNAWDLFTDAQLWGAAALLQIVRSFLPFGYMWSPILDQMIVILSTLQSGSIERLSFYKSTTAFTNYLLETGDYESIVLLGHSLGGGLAIISGAQSGVQAVGISGPNALISRRRFDVTKANLERYTFNTIPDRDPIAAIDDPTKNLQKIECRAAHNEVLGCHSIIRSLCETMYMCGSGGRPFVCECVSQFGFPYPVRGPNATASFKEVCANTGLWVEN